MSQGRNDSSQESLRRPLLSSSEEDAKHSEMATDLEQPPSFPEGLMIHPVEPRSSNTLDHSNSKNPAALTEIGHTERPELRQRRGRILDRDAAFYQSRGRWSVQHVSRGEARIIHTTQGGPRLQTFTKRFWDNWFHTLAYQKTYVLMLILFFVYAAIIFGFAFVYLFVSLSGATTSIDPSDGSTHTQMFCHMDIHDHMDALYFSLSTMTTIGYGVSDYYFGGCWTPLMLVLWQVCVALIFNAVSIGLIFQRISRGNKRSKTIIFSDKAAIRRVRGVPHLYIRLAELRHHQLLEASVRAYCVRHERYHQEQDHGVVETTHFVTKPMKLTHEAVGSHIMMSLPQIIVHCMDADSPLVAPDSWCDANGQLRHCGVNSHSRSQRDYGSEDKERCFLQETEEMNAFLMDREAEIVILLEGTDELTGSVLQTRHSYTLDEIVWNERFAPCTFPYSEYVATLRPDILVADRTEPFCVVDFARFHETIPAPLDSESCPFVRA
jgi:hypothetical protein